MVQSHIRLHIAIDRVPLLAAVGTQYVGVAGRVSALIDALLQAVLIHVLTAAPAAVDKGQPMDTSSGASVPKSISRFIRAV
jgi:hypothetical protein